MKIFKDLKGQDWTLALSIDAAWRIKSLAGVDLMKVISGGEKSQELFTDMATDLYTLGSVLWAVCQPQAVARNIDETAFAAGLADGDLLRAAAAALTDEVVDFFDKFRGTTVLRKALSKMRAATERINQKSLDALDQMDAQLERTIQSAFGETSGPHRDDSESTPAASPTDNSA